MSDEQHRQTGCSAGRPLMDPIAHTLVGASLSETRLGRLTHLAAPTLVLAANAPDIDILSLAGGGDFSLGFRRGWTHGVLALVVLPVVLAGLILLAERVVARLRHRSPRGRAAPVVALAYVGTLTHPALDWLNTYGIRLLMPFDDRWFYGDALFIVDPWVWLLLGAVIVVGRTHSRTSRGAWLVAGTLLTGLITVFAPIPPLARATWVVGVSAIIAIRLWTGPRAGQPRFAVICMAVATLYIAAMVAGSRLASGQAAAWLAERGTDATVVMTGPLPGNPFSRDIIVRDDSHYHFLEVRWFQGERVRIGAPAIERGPFDGPIVAAALAAPQVRGVTTWMRFPAYTVDSDSDGYTVTIQDVRYARGGNGGLGTASIELDPNLRVQGR